MNGILENKEIVDLIDDYKNCEHYLLELNNGNVRYLNEAINFVNSKYVEFFIKESVITLMNTNFIPSDLDNLSQTIKNINAIKKIIIGIIYKKCNG